MKTTIYLVVEKYTSSYSCTSKPKAFYLSKRAAEYHAFLMKQPSHGFRGSMTSYEVIEIQAGEPIDENSKGYKNFADSKATEIETLIKIKKACEEADRKAQDKLLEELASYKHEN